MNWISVSAALAHGNRRDINNMKFIFSTSLFAVALAGEREAPEDGSPECLADYEKLFGAECMGNAENNGMGACADAVKDTFEAEFPSPTDAQECDRLKAAMATCMTAAQIWTQQ